MARRWTARELARVKSLYQDGRNDHHIANFLNRTAPAISKKRSQIGAVAYTRHMNKKDKTTQQLRFGQALDQPAPSLYLSDDDRRIGIRAPDPRDPTFQESFGPNEFGSGRIAILIDAQGHIECTGHQWTPRQAVRIMALCISRLL